MKHSRSAFCPRFRALLAVAYGFKWIDGLVSGRSPSLPTSSSILFSSSNINMSFQSTLRSSTRQISRSFSTTRSNPKIYLQASSKEFNSRVLDASSPDRSKIILAKFTASWCPPCKVLKPILKKMQEEEGKQLTGKEVDVMEIDVDEQQELAAQFKVRKENSGTG